MEWSRTQTGRMEFKPEKLEIISLIEREIELLNDSARQKKITIETELPKRSYAMIDPSMFMTIVRNLISNAIKFTGLDGTIRISVIESEQYAEIAVSDNGIGIKKENIENLFHIEKDQSTPGTQNEKGTGLGLILCKEFVDKHGGKIWVESESGKGSCFHFTITR